MTPPYSRGRLRFLATAQVTLRTWGPMFDIVNRPAVSAPMLTAKGKSPLNSTSDRSEPGWMEEAENVS